MVLRNKMPRSTDQASAIVDEMSESAAAARAEAARIVAMIRDLGADGLKDVRSALRDRLPGDLDETLHGMGARLGEELRAHPMRSLGVAALAGLALGVMLRR